MSTTERLFSPTQLALAATVCGGVLFGLYPHNENLLHTVSATDELKNALSSPLETEYARMMADKNPPSLAVIMLAQRLAQNHAWQESEQLLQRLPIGINATLQQIAAWLHVLNRLDAYYVSKSDTDFRAVQTQLQALTAFPQWESQTRQLIAQHCVNFGLYTQAVTHYAQLAQQDTAHSTQWFERAATTATHAELWQEAADYWQRTRDSLSVARGKINPYAYQWLEAAIKAGRTTEAANYLEKLSQPLPNQTEALTRLAGFSLQLGKPALATAMYQQLATVDPESAQTWLEKAAYWSQTTGSYHLAADSLQQANNVAQQETERLSLQFRTIAVWVKAKQAEQAAAALQPLLNRPEYANSVLDPCINVAYLAEEQQQQRLAETLWQWVLAHSDDPSLWQHVAIWQEGQSKYAAALATWMQIESRFGASNQTRLMRIQVLWEAKNHQQAYRLAKVGGNGLVKTANRYQRAILLELAKHYNNTIPPLAMR